jgi:LPS O-antigen subunit length determinant protein (WzzB/FepE family)
MKKNNPYIADDEIDLSDLIRMLWREKILILSISIICGLLGYLYALFNFNSEFKVQIKLQDPPFQLFEGYTYLVLNNKNNVLNNKNNNILIDQFVSNFKLNFLSLDNLQTFVEESRDLDSFKKYLKSRNISTRQYFGNKLGEVKENNKIISNTYFFVFEKKILDGDIFIGKYVEYIKKKNIIEFKKNLKLTIENKINITEDAFEIAKIINLEYPILKSSDRLSQVIAEPEALFYQGTKVLSQSIIIYKKLLQNLEKNQFNFNPISDKGIITPINPMSSYFYFLTGLFVGFFLFCIFALFKSALKNK